MPVDFVKQVDSYKTFKETFCLDPELWAAFSTLVPLTWNRVRFVKVNNATIPACRGVYAFVVMADATHFPSHGYVMYVGETGQKNNRTLRVRFSDYLREQKKKKRAAIHYMLRKWKRNLYFFFAEVTDKRHNLKRLEKQLNDALFPPYSTNDFTAEVRDIKKAFQR